MTTLVVCLLGPFLTGTELRAQENASGSDREDLSMLTGNDLVAVQLHADIATFRPGQEFTVAVEYDIRPGWHIYWRNSGDSGMPPEVTVRAPSGIVVGKVLFPRPRIFQKSQGTSTETTFGYEGKVCLLVPLKIPETFKGSELDLSVDLQWLVCKSICLLGSQRLSLSLPAALPERPATVDPFGLRLVNVWRKRLPISTAQARVSASVHDGSLVVSGSAGLSRTVLFIPDSTPGVTSIKRVPVSGTVVGRLFTLNIPLEIRPEDALGEPLRAAGLVLLGSYDRPRAIAIDIPLSYPDIPRDDPGSSGAEPSEP